MKTVNIHEAKTHLSRLLQEAADGEDIIIARAGKPIARLVAFTESTEPRNPGCWRGRVWMADDFDETPQEVVDAFYGEGS